jgi:hypothetical protein
VKLVEKGEAKAARNFGPVNPCPRNSTRSCPQTGNSVRRRRTIAAPANRVSSPDCYPLPSFRAKAALPTLNPCRRDLRCRLLPSPDFCTRKGGQSGAKPGWPCVPGRPVDPAYLEASESTGGQLFLFQKNEVAQSALVMNAPHTHPATVLRAVGNLNGTSDFEFPVDPGMSSLLLLASVQCRNAILVYRPGGSELTDRNSALSVDLLAGRILRIDQPEGGL